MSSDRSTLPPRLPLVLLLVWGMALSACGDGERDRSDRSDEAAADRRSGGTLRLALEADPQTLDPLHMTTSQAARVFALLQPGLFRLDPETGVFRPGLAERWGFEADSLHFHVVLDTTLRWSDGRAFRSDDVVASFELYLDERAAYPRRQRLSTIESMEALDEATVRFGFERTPSEPLLLLSHDVLPAHRIEGWDPERDPALPIGTEPVTLGPYRLARWERNQRLVLERNPHHPGPPGYVDRIELRVLPDATTRVLQLRTGEVDVVGSIPPATADGMADEPGVRVLELPGRTMAFLQYNLEDPALAETKLRRALSHAVDRAAIVERVYFGYGRPAASFFPPVSWAHEPSLEPVAFDPDEARRLLDEAGFRDRDGDGRRERADGEVLSLDLMTVSGDPDRQAVATLLQSWWDELGIETRIRALELGGFVGALRQKEFQVALAHLGGPIDADVRPFLSSTGGFNFGSYANDEVDRLARLAATATARTVAQQAAHELQRQLTHDQPVSMLYYPWSLVGVAERVRDARPSYLSPFHRAERWWLEGSPRDRAVVE